MIKHGTQNRYRKGCRCEACTDAHRIGQAEQRRLRLSRPIPDTVAHDRNAYVNWGCRCDICRQDHNKYMNKYRKELREKRKAAS